MTHERPGFWLALAAIFVVNALLAAWQSHLLLACLQVATAGIAVRAAVLLAREGRAPSPPLR